MARNRMIKPEFWTSTTNAKCSIPARLTFIGIWNFCDDYGFIIDSIRSLLGDIYPMDENVNESELSTWIDELVSNELLIRVSYHNKKLLFVSSWHEHQKVPNPSKRMYVEVVDQQELISHYLDTNESLITSDVSKEKEKEERTEKKEKEKEGKADRELKFTTLSHAINLEDNILESDDLLKFNNYWTESNSGESAKMRFEKEKTFDAKRRMVTWSNPSWNTAHKQEIKEIPTLEELTNDN